MEEKNIITGEEKKSLSFVEQFVKEDLEAGKNGGRLQTRFPPEPNGYIHIGHAKAICMDFGVAEEFGGKCNLRFDDTNPTKENTEYVENIMSDIKWLGFHWENVYYASDYFEKLWDFAVWLIKKGLGRPGWVGVPFCSAICSEVCSSTYARPLLISQMAKSHNLSK